MCASLPRQSTASAKQASSLRRLSASTTPTPSLVGPLVAQVKAWSDAHPQHGPLFIRLEPRVRSWGQQGMSLGACRMGHAASRVRRSAHCCAPTAALARPHAGQCASAPAAGCGPLGPWHCTLGTPPSCRVHRPLTPDTHGPCPRRTRLWPPKRTPPRCPWSMEC